jgi:hypothetical protein
MKLKIHPEYAGLCGSCRYASLAKTIGFLCPIGNGANPGNSGITRTGEMMMISEVAYLRKKAPAILADHRGFF